MAASTDTGHIDLPSPIPWDTQHTKPEEGSFSLAQGRRHFEGDGNVEQFLVRGGQWNRVHYSGGVVGVDSGVGEEVLLLEG